ncbi:MAG TPA: response regulator, partial [Novosphingobium sp.]|nr:response regulator [Novosphingobium sp.]
PAEPCTSARAGEPLAVLVLDNDPLTVEATSALLATMGHVPVGAFTPEAARAQAGRVDAVLADFRLDATGPGCEGRAGGEDGLDVVASLRALCPGLPALLITAECDPAIRLRAEGMGIPMHAKPIAPAVIEGFVAGVRPRA